MTTGRQTIEAEVRSIPRRDRSVGRTRALSEPRARGSALFVLQLSLWLGLIAGLGEVGLTFAQKPLIDPSPGLFRMNRHLLWTIPTIDFAVLALIGLPAALARRVAPGLGLRPLIAPLVFLATFALVLSCRWLHVLACLPIALVIMFRLTWRIDRNLTACETLVQRTLPGLALVVAGLVGLTLGQQVIREQSPADIAPASINTAHKAPNVLLIVLDTVRADHLSLYGYSRETTPNLSRLSRRSVTFTQARSAAPWTLPSHASMMTGRWPHELSTGVYSPLDATYPTLADCLGASGYATAGFVGNVTYCGIETGLGRGFVHFEDHVLSLADVLWTSALGQRVILEAIAPPERRARGNPNDYHRKDAASIRRDMLTWLQSQGNRPFFAFLNLYDAHDPYIPPAEFRRRFGTKAVSEDHMAILERWFIADKNKVTSSQIHCVRDAYDDGIAYLDEQLGLLFDDLEHAGRLANTVVIITADHGEELGDHGLYGHASSLYDGEVHVPLLIFLPGAEHGGETVDVPVSLHDLAPTVAEITGLGDSPFPGRSLTRYWAASAPQPFEPLLCEVDAPVKSAPNRGRSPVFRGPMKAVTSGRHVYIKNGDGKEELFDIDSDPSQSRDLSKLPQSGPILDQLRTTLERLLHHEDAEPVLVRLEHLQSGPKRGCRLPSF